MASPSLPNHTLRNKKRAEVKQGAVKSREPESEEERESRSKRRECRRGEEDNSTQGRKYIKEINAIRKEVNKRNK